MSAHTPAWHAVPDAVGVARQWRPADLRGLPATLRYGASLSGVALAAARGRPRTVLLVDDDGPVTGAVMETIVDLLAADLASAIRRAGAGAAAICCGGHRGFVAAVAAAGALGLDLTVVPPRSGSVTLLAALEAAAVVVVDGGTRREVSAAAPAAVLVDAQPEPSRLPGRSLRAVPRPRRPGALSVLTSGTTGVPRPARRPGAAWGQLATVLSLIRALDPRRDEPVVIAPPLGHGHGLSVLTAALVVGSPAVLAHGRSGPDLVDLVREHGAGVLAVVPAQLAGFVESLAAGVDRLPTLRRVATGSAPLPADLVERTHGLLGELLVDFYGSSELGTATIAAPADLRVAPGTVGRPAAGVRIEVVDDDGVPVPAGVVGTVRVSSPWRADAVESGPVEVGDRGHLDSSGRLFLAGRLDEVVVVGGHNVSVASVREWFGRQPGVEAVVVTVEGHPVLGDQLRVVVHGAVDLDRLRARAVGELGTAAAPRWLERG